MNLITPCWPPQSLAVFRESLENHCRLRRRPRLDFFSSVIVRDLRVAKFYGRVTAASALRPCGNPCQQAMREKEGAVVVSPRSHPECRPGRLFEKSVGSGQWI